MRLCNICKLKPVRNEKQYKCRECHNEYQKLHYKLKPNSIRESGIKRKKEIRTLVVSVKNVPCKDCNVPYPYYVMDFDHVRGIKKFNISQAGSRHMSLKTLNDEINKCDIVCANCHRERTFKRLLGNGVIGNTFDSESKE